MCACYCSYWYLGQRVALFFSFAGNIHTNAHRQSTTPPKPFTYTCTCGVVSLASLYSRPPRYRLARETLYVVTFAYHEME